VDAVFIVKIVRLILCPVCKVIRLIIRPDESTLVIYVVKSNPALGTIQTMLYIDILFLIFNADEVGVVQFAGVLSFSPVLA